MAFAADAVYVGVEERLSGDAALLLKLTQDASVTPAGPGIFAEGEVPEAQPLVNSTVAPSRHGYVVIRGSGETPNDMFGQEGGDGTLRISVHAWNKKWALTIAGMVHRLLHNYPITINGHRLVEGSCLLLTDFADPGGGHTAHLEYAATTVVTG
jgi:hypothetical protein